MRAFNKLAVEISKYDKKLVENSDRISELFKDAKKVEVFQKVLYCLSVFLSFFRLSKFCLIGTRYESRVHLDATGRARIDHPGPGGRTRHHLSARVRCFQAFS